MPRTSEQQLVLNAFGHEVKAARDARGWTQEELGEFAGMHRTYVGAIERGEKNLSLLKMNQLALALDEGFDGFLPCLGEAGKSTPSSARRKAN